jgi:hypothetical protein
MLCGISKATVSLMVKLWRKFVVWMRTLLLKLYRKENIVWAQEIIKLLDIIREILNKKQSDENKVPNYNITGKIPKPRRRFFRRFRRR